MLILPSKCSMQHTLTKTPVNQTDETDQKKKIRNGTLRSKTGPGNLKATTETHRIPETSKITKSLSQIRKYK